MRCAACLLLFAAGAAGANITLQVSSETAPAGGTAQFKITVTAPALISTASIAMSFDPAVFGPIANIAAFSATEDQVGYANVNVNGQQLTAYVSSASASLGQLPGLPVFIVTVPILAAARSGVSSVTVDPSGSPWGDQQGNTYTVGVNPGTFTVGGSLSIQAITPGGGYLPSGTVVSITGTGFDASTAATIDGVSLATTQFVSAQQIDLTLGGAMELTGKHLHILTGSGARADFFCSLPSAPANAPPGVFPLLSLATYTNVTWDRPDSPDYVESIALLNQNLSPVTVTFLSPADTHVVMVSPSITIPAGELYLLPTTIGFNPFEMVSTAPMRMLEYRVNSHSQPPQAYVFPPSPPQELSPPSVSPSAASWTWQVGTIVPAPIAVNITGDFPYTATISSAPWLTISPAQGIQPGTLTLTPGVSSLGPGTYAGTVTIHTVLPASLSSLSLPDIVLPVSIQVSASPFISVSGNDYFTAGFGDPPQLSDISLTTSGTPAQFSVSVSTSAGGNWLSVSPSSGTTNAVIHVAADPTGLDAGTYSGNVIVQGPANTVTFPVELVKVAISGGPKGPALNPPSFTFALAAGTAFYQYQFNGGANFILASASAQTQSGGNWLTVLCCDRGLYFDLSATSLTPGSYQGTVTLVATSGASLQVPITLIVLTPAAPLTVTPASVSLTVQAGQSITQSFAVISTPSTLFRASGGIASATYTPATVTAGFEPAQPGTIYSSITFTSGSGSVTVPIVLNVTATPSFPPILASVVSAASGVSGAISPGEIISLYGTGLGSHVLIDNIDVPVIYASSGQVNAVVPYEAGSSSAATVQVVAAGLATAVWTIPISPSAPSLFTAGASGVGQGAIVNQDGSINSASNPAPRGTAIQIYATGGGQTSPASLTGGVAEGAASLLLPVSVSVGGANARVLYAGSAPGELNGVVQINAVVPQNATPGAALPVAVTIGGIASQPGITISVQ